MVKNSKNYISNFDWKGNSWENSLGKLFFLQKRLYKSVFVGDLKVGLTLQKLILYSNCARLLAIRYVTQISPYKKIAGLDGKTSLTFMERYELNHFLKIHVNNWISQSLKKVLIVEKDGANKSICISTIADRTWQILIKFSLEPAHEASFHPLNFGFRSGYSLYDLQNYIFLILGAKAFGYQKRIFFVNLERSLISFNIDYLLRKLIAPRSVKLGIFKLLKKGFPLSFPIDEKFEIIDLSILLTNVLLDGIENVHKGVRFGYHCLYFLNPLDNEKIVFEKIDNFLRLAGVRLEFLLKEIKSIFGGFDFLGWHFVLLRNTLDLVSVPTFDNYQVFLKRVKHIINNSNYGSEIKINKLYPIIKDWRLYHKFSNLSQVKFSLFFVKKKAFKIFSKESKQDFYSIKRILAKSFYNLTFYDRNNIDKAITDSPYYGHMTFWNEFYFFSTKHKIIINICCVHCGMVF